MTARDKKLKKLLCVLGPILLLTLWYGYSEIQAGKAKKAARRKKAQEQSKKAAPSEQTNNRNNAAGQGTRALPSPPPGATPADNRASVPPAAPFAGVRVAVNTAAQGKRAQMPWGRDPFVPPDTQGPKILAPADMESPRGKDTIELKVHISDSTTGNSGMTSAVLRHGADPRSPENATKGSPPGAPNRDGDWTFTVPAPKDRPLNCYIVAIDAGRLQNTSRSPAFKITPPPRETVTAQSTTGGRVKLTLRGISWAREKGVALINDDVVAQGEYIHGYEVVRVAKNAVVLKRNDKEIVLELKE